MVKLENIDIVIMKIDMVVVLLGELVVLRKICMNGYLVGVLMMEKRLLM